MWTRQPIVSAVVLVVLCVAELSEAFTVLRNRGSGGGSIYGTTRYSGTIINHYGTGNPVAVLSTGGIRMTNNNKDNDDAGSGNDIPRDEEMIGAPAYESSVDWDAEWKKVVREQKRGGGKGTIGNKNKPRPGDGYYKTEAEIKAIQAANKAAFEAQKVRANLPSWQMLKGDWKVCT